MILFITALHSVLSSSWIKMFSVTFFKNHHTPTQTYSVARFHTHVTYNLSVISATLNNAVMLESIHDAELLTERNILLTISTQLLIKYLPWPVLKQQSVSHVTDHSKVALLQKKPWINHYIPWQLWSFSHSSYLSYSQLQNWTVCVQHKKNPN
jgi:hypothetical protein